MHYLKGINIMKRVLCAVLAVIMLVGASLAASAVDFVASIEEKNPPEVVPIEHDDEYYGAVIVDREDPNDKEYVSYYDKDVSLAILEFLLTSIADKDKAVLPGITEALNNSEKQVRTAEDLGKLFEGLKTDIEKKIDDFFGKGKVSMSDLHVTDLFDASFIFSKDQLVELQKGKYARFMINPPFSEKDFFILLNNTNGTNWEVVETEWTKEGNLIITVDEVGVFAIVREKTKDLPVDPHGPDSPQTDIGRDYTYIYLAVAAICVGLAVVCFVKAKMRKDAE